MSQEPLDPKSFPYDRYLQVKEKRERFLWEGNSARLTELVRRSI